MSMEIKYNEDEIISKIEEIYNKSPNKLIKFTDLEKILEIPKYNLSKSYYIKSYIKNINTIIRESKNKKTKEKIENRILYDYCIKNNKEYLLQEWDYEKNDKLGLTPYNVTFGKNDKVWWKCKKGHEWEASINSRAGKDSNKCPKCSRIPKVSFPEKSVYFYVKQVFQDAIANYKPEWIKPKEIDIFIPSLNLAIEYDGGFVHKKKHSQKRDNVKNTLIKQKNIMLIRIREVECLPLNFNENVIIYPQKNNDWDMLNKNIYNIFLYIISNYKLNEKQKHIIDNLKINIVDDMIKIFELMDLEEKENSLAVKNPQLAKEWHPTKNGCLSPYNFSHHSQFNAWWLCKKCHHEWQSRICSRNKSNGKNGICPKCNLKNRKLRNLTKDNNLMICYPEIAKEWHSIKNGTLTPYDVTPKSAKKVWWKCSKNPSHEWEAKIDSRTNGSGCPYCSGKRVCLDNCLATLNPQLASEWHPTKNGNLTPYDVTAGSGKEVWWLCKDNHEWKDTINNRNNGGRCRHCVSLITLHPDIAKEWNFDKNEHFTPYDFTSSSGKEVWWICNKGHEWKARISHRTNGSTCPYCSGRYPTKENNLAVKNPQLAKEWHPTKNGNLTPYDVTCGTKRKVWWKCLINPKHEWEAQILNRNNGTGCPYCSSRGNGKKAIIENCLATVNPKLAQN